MQRANTFVNFVDNFISFFLQVNLKVYIYFISFQGSKFYHYEDFKWDGKAARNISDFWIGLPNDVDAAFFSQKDIALGIIFVTKGETIYKLQLTLTRGTDHRITQYGYVMKGFPKPIKSLFPRLPGNLDTAYNTYCDFKTLFIKGNFYYEASKDLIPFVYGPYPLRDLVPGFCMQKMTTNDILTEVKERTFEYTDILQCWYSHCAQRDWAHL